MSLRFDSNSHEVTGSVQSKKEMFGIQGIYSPVTRRLAITRTHQPNPRAIGILPKRVVFLRLSWDIEANMFVGQWYESQKLIYQKGQRGASIWRRSKRTSNWTIWHCFHQHLQLKSNRNKYYAPVVIRERNLLKDCFRTWNHVNRLLKVFSQLYRHVIVLLMPD